MWQEIQNVTGKSSPIMREAMLPDELITSILSTKTEL